MKKFGISEDFLTQTTVRYGYTDTSGTYCVTTSNVDHPSFDALRTYLGNVGLIKIERGWWNGDRVVEPFILNDKEFEVGERFPSAGAMKGHLKYKD